MTKILWINPVGTDLFDHPIEEFLLAAKGPETQLDVVSLDRGPLHLEYHYYEALILADTLHRVRRAEREGYDAAVIGCFYDPGLREAREIAERMVVTAPAESAMHIASTLGHTFSILVGRKKWIPKMHENVVQYGFTDRLASFKSLELGVYDFQRDPAETARRLREAAKSAVEEDRAEAIILGCTIEFGFYQELQAELGVPVIDAVVAPLKYAEFLVELRERFGWSHSKVYGYQSPPRSEIAGWELEKQFGIPGLWE
ncbi:MAG: aspartate/glutamate racemase family protein [Candidatus Bipolaricaulaceae bacterium]